MRDSPFRRLRAALTTVPRDKELLDELSHQWLYTARDEQLPPPGLWSVLAWIGGRGMGKTRPCAELLVRAGMYPSMCAGRLALVARTAADVRDTMIYGESGMLACADRLEIHLHHIPSLRQLKWRSGTVGTTYSADEPRQLRGPQHGGAWADELAWWPDEAAEDRDAWKQLRDGLRLGAHPWCLVSTTPRPIEKLRALVRAEDAVVIGGSTLDNRENLPTAYIEDMLRRYEGTRIGRQELYGEILPELAGQLWSLDTIEKSRAKNGPAHYQRVVIAIDPAVTNTKESDETGIVVAGLADNHAWVIRDLSGKYSPHEWGQLVAWAYREYRVDRVLGETNNGGDLVEAVLRTAAPNIPYKGVHASRGKLTRAEPVSALYEQKKVHHIGVHYELEDQMVKWTPGIGDSPDRVDALVYAITDLMLDDVDVAPSAYSKMRSL